MMIRRKGIFGLAAVVIGLVSLPEARADFVPLKCDNNGGESVFVYPTTDGKTYFEVRGAFCPDGQYYPDPKRKIAILSIGFVGEKKGDPGIDGCLRSLGISAPAKVKEVERRVAVAFAGPGLEEVVTVKSETGEEIQSGKVLDSGGDKIDYCSHYALKSAGLEGRSMAFNSVGKPLWSTRSNFRESTQAVIDSAETMVFTTIFEKEEWNGPEFEARKITERVRVFDGEGTIDTSRVTVESRYTSGAIEEKHVAVNGNGDTTGNPALGGFEKGEKGWDIVMKDGVKTYKDL